MQNIRQKLIYRPLFEQLKAIYKNKKFNLLKVKNEKSTCFGKIRAKIFSGKLI